MAGGYRNFVGPDLESAKVVGCSGSANEREGIGLGQSSEAGWFI